MNIRFHVPEGDENESVALIGKGDTLLEALAMIDAQLVALYGVEASLTQHHLFVIDFSDIVEAMEEVDGFHRCHDFSCPEDEFTLTRIQ